MDKTLISYLSNLDNRLKELAMSDGSVEYAPHQREPFDKIIKEVNRVKMYLGSEEKYLHKSDWYFN